MGEKEHLYKPQQYSLLYYTSWIALFSGIYAMYQNCYDIALCNLCVCCTSLLHWRKPFAISWFRSLDLLISKLAILYGVFRAYKSQYFFFAYLYGALSTYCYILSTYCYNLGYTWRAVVLHLFVHLFANVSSVILCSGYLQPIEANFQVFYPYGFLSMTIGLFGFIFLIYY